MFRFMDDVFSFVDELFLLFVGVACFYLVQQTFQGVELCWQIIFIHLIALSFSLCIRFSRLQG